MRTAAINASLQRRITAARLVKYLAAAGNDLDTALSMYEYNTRLSEAFYTPLQCLEICLRNTIHEAMAAAYGPNWLTTGSVPLSTASARMIAEARSDLQRRGIRAAADDIVAELKFAFWVGLLGPGYDATLWRQALYKGFSVGGRRKRHMVHGRLNLIRRLRNRIAHHEPIFHRNTLADHAEIVEAIGWMCADTAAWATYHSRLPAVLQGA